MRRIFCLVFSFFLAGGLLLAQEVPFLSGRVNDYAGILTSQTVSELEGVLKAHEQMTSNQMAVLTVASLEGQALEEYSIKVAESWKLGQQEKDNGVLFLVARDDRKVRIEVGDGLEGTLTDARCSQIIRHEIVPQFKKGDYDGGIRAGVQAILGTIEGTYTEEGETFEGEGFESTGEKIIGLAIFTFVVGMFTLIGLMQRGFIGWFLYVFLMPFWLLFPMAILGTFIPFVVYLIAYPILKSILVQNPTFKRWQESWVSARTSGGGWSSGGWSSGGGGGFSGGGGSFSGGGSSGSW